MHAIASFKALARDACGQVLSLAGVTAPAVRLRHRLSIITFHRVLTAAQRAAYPLPGLAVTPDELDAHLQFARRHFRCMSLTAALDLWGAEGADGLPILAITFDDGQLDNYENALPVLEQHGVSASFYIPSRVLEDPSPLWPDALATSMAHLLALAPDRRTEALIAPLRAGPEGEKPTGRLDIELALEATKGWNAAQRQEWLEQAQRQLPPANRPAWDGFMNVDQLKALVARGHEIGSHSHSHPLLPQCSDDELVAEVMGSRRALEAALGTPVTTFCYPNGSTDARSIDCARRAGYRAAVTTQWGGNLPGSDLFQLKRFDMHARHAQDRRGRFSASRLAWRMSGLYPGLGRKQPDPYRGATA